MMRSTPKPLFSLLSLSLVVLLAAVMTLAAPSLSSDMDLQATTDDVSYPTDNQSAAVTDASSSEESTDSTTDSPLPTEEPSKLAKVLEKLSKQRGGEEVKRVQAMLNKKRAKAAQKYAQRSEKEKQHEKDLMKEMNQMEEVRSGLNKGVKKEKDIKRIPTANQESGVDQFMYQGDMRLTEEQAKFFLGDDSARNNAGGEVVGKLNEVKQVKEAARPKRQVMVEGPTNGAAQWPNANVYYSFASDVPASLKTLVYAAIDLWERSTCINFYEDASQPNSFRVTTLNSGCWSYLGMLKTTPNQTLSLQAGACEDVGVAAHEIGHALGLLHTMARADADSNIYVFANNVDPSALSQYNETAANQQQSYGSTYDLNSIMHYFRTAFRKASLTSGNTVTTKVSPVRTTFEWDQTIGQDRTPSIADFKLINNFYNCPQWCSNTLTCYGGGYQRPGYRPAGDGCTTCVCPPGIGGASCNTPVSSDIAPGYVPSGVPNTCTGGRLNATTTWKWINGTIGSTSQDTPADWAWCHWWMQAPTGYHLQIEVTSINAACGDGCGASYLEVRTGNANLDWGVGGRRICCSGDLALQNSTSLIFNSPSNTGGREAMISSYNRYWKQTFTLRYKAVLN